MKITIEIDNNIDIEKLSNLKNKIIKLSYENKYIKKSSLKGFGFVLALYPKNYKNSFLKKIGVLG
jgi:hypothetical protein